MFPEKFKYILVYLDAMLYVISITGCFNYL